MPLRKPKITRTTKKSLSKVINPKKSKPGCRKCGR